MRNAIEEHQMSRPSQMGLCGTARGTRFVKRGVAVLLILGGTACSLDGLLKSDKLPQDVSDPAIQLTPDGARRAYSGVLAKFQKVFAGTDNSFVAEAALLSDELQDPSAGSPAGVDQRNLPAGNSSLDATYSDLQQARAQAGQAIALLADFLPDQPELRGRLYALKGYTEIFLAELFCSGIPLSTLDYGGDYTYQPGSTTEQVLTHAIALFDTALGLVGDSARFVQLARVGKARALLALGQYAAAAAATAAVPDGYRYSVDYYDNVDNSPGTLNNFISVTPSANNTQHIWSFSVSDGEGFNGLRWRSSGDPRTPTVEQTVSGATVYFPTNYAINGSTPIIVANAVEARLVEAEAALSAGSGTWLATLNALRTDGTFDTTATSLPDTLWHPGTGGVAGLAPLADPGTETGRVDLLFHERAFWLFLTGHRQGDLRRLIRQYDRDQGLVYPVGSYPAQPVSTFPYGDDVTAPIPSRELINPLFTGCASRAA